MKVLYKEKPRTIAIYSESHSLVFQLLKGLNNSVAVELIPNEQVTREKGFRILVQREISGCLGLINVEDQVFLVVITRAVQDVASPVEYESVDRIYSVEFISLVSDEWDFVNLDSNGFPIVTAANGTQEEETSDYARSVHPCQELKKLLSNSTFYYSNNFDLTSLLQNRGIIGDRIKNGDGASVRKLAVEHYQQDYMWNSFMMEELINFRSNLEPYVQSILDDNHFLTTVIRGFAKTIRLNSSGDSISVISKQSWRRAGTRFNARGIDDNGYVANFVETEFIFNCPSQSSIFAFVQIRGSVPTFWEQDSTLINPKITLTRSLGATQPVFNKHFSDICNKYGVCHIVNLLSKTKSAEVAVLRRYKELYTQSDHREETTFSEFDFHHETKPASGGFAGASKILALLHQSLEQFGWFYYDTEQGEVCTRQDGVFRTNCLDCLDRTNLIQQVISQYILEHILRNQSLNHGNSSRDRARIEDTINRHNSLWADNGDAISQIYTGTNALKSSFSRSGKMNFAGALSDVTKSVSRMYQNTFVDGKKQSTMDLLLGYDSKNSIPVQIYDPINEHVAGKLKSKAGIYTTWKDIIIFAGTYNVNALDPSFSSIDLSSWLFPPENLDLGLPDVYAIGLQEIIELNAGSILNADASKPTKWANILTDQLNSNGEQYLLLRTESMSSMSLFLFVKQSQVHNVTQVAGSSKKTGMGGMTANKGACAVRFDYGLTSFALITSHLAAGTAAVTERFNDYSTIMQGLTFTRNYTIADHDQIIWFGDLNYRISMTNDQCRSLIEHGAFDELLAVDQLNQEMTQKGAFYGFKEGRIKFYPTYKFDKGTSNYDSSEKQRVPSWTDRILFKSARGINDLKQLNYNSVMSITLSDHKPVFSTLAGKVECIDREKKTKLFKSLYDSYKSEHGNSDISLLDIDSSSTSRASNSSASSTFTIDTLSEMNILEDNSSPSQLGATKASKLPRRLPPTPSSRSQVPDSSSFPQKPIPRKLPPPFDLGQNQNPPTPPPARKTIANLMTASSESIKVPFGFSSAPLIPSRSNSTTPSKEISSTSGNTTHSESVKPMIPTKPTNLAGNKSRTSDVLSQNSFESESHRTTNVSTPTGTLHGENGANGANVNEETHKPNFGSLSDWKPLIPK
ncbi:DNase I-like protein [Suhomyces tanzawaensis NRRL Y-17324]|uniref:phosphoinositide 5-phosphatase n=1 Tax=Suhomyces tanzawaensis NRRL Y-17324 TaxID=984487 RepID=A0A1E4SHS7_9ASCO|nr:DNase I-like protein [Suhomyces tanzawaensis NRRL Y-17324]ODV79053.1 DNase I-like protein [Suhomyces tanzawaensis NRRL Y-17324]